MPLPPQIVFQPQSQSVVAGNYAYFSVSAAGTTPLTYQWRKEGTNLPGAIQTYYSIVNVQTNDASTYSVVVSNAAGDVPSSNAVLTVNQPPAPLNVSH